MGMGIPEEHARYYEGEAKAGRTLVTVRADGDYDQARQTLMDHGAYDVESRNETAVRARRTIAQWPVRKPRTACSCARKSS